MGKQKGSPHHSQNGAPTSSQQQAEKPRKDAAADRRAVPTLKQRIWAKIEASLWVIGAIVAVVYGDGVSTLPQLLLHDGRIRR